MPDRTLESIKIPRMPRTGTNHMWDNVPEVPPEGCILKFKIPQGYQTALKAGDTVNNDFLIVGRSNVDRGQVIVAYPESLF
jgi:hypothetical protein